MNLLSLGALTPHGATLKDHVNAKAAGCEARRDFMTYNVDGSLRKIAVHRAQESSVTLPVPDGVLRRMGMSTRMVLTSLEEAQKKLDFDLRSRKVGILVGTTQGPSSTNIEYFKKLVQFNYRGASPNLFAQSVHNNIASSVALTYNWRGPTLTLVQEENLWPALMNVAQLWLQEKTVDNVWIIVGNEMSLHLPYIHLHEHVRENPTALEFNPAPRAMSQEAYSVFLLGNDAASPEFTLTNTTKILQDLEVQLDRSITKPEQLGVALAEHFYTQYFAEPTP